MIKKFCNVFLLIFLLGCSPMNPNSFESPTATSVPAITIQPSVTVPPTLPVALTKTPMLGEINRECIEVKPNPEKKAEGILVFQKEYGSRLLFVHPKGGNQKLVPDDTGVKVWRAYVSPDGG